MRFFYWLPWMILLVYFFGSYSEFIFNIGLYPNNIDQLMILLIPKNYNFSFVGLLLGYLVSLIMFFWNIKRNETKKVWIDIFFLSTVLALVPWGIFAIF